MKIISRYKGFIYLGICWVVLLSSCYEDKGNYDYNWVEDVYLETNFRDTTVQRGERLTIVPELAKVIDKNTGKSGQINPEDYTYSWVAVGINTKMQNILGTERNLDTLIWLETSESYWLKYTVTEKSSGVAWTNRFTLKVVKRLVNGYLFMTENDAGSVELEVYGKDSKGDNIHETKVMERSGFPYSGGGANGVYYSSQANSHVKYLWISTGQATGWLMLPDFTWNEKQLVRMKMVTSTFENYSVRTFCQMSGQATFLLSAEGNSHVLTNNDIVFPDFAYVNKQKFVASPYIGGTAVASVLFDEDRKCFVLCTQTGSAISTPSGNCTDVAEDVAYKGSTLIYMQCVNSNKTVAVLKDKSGKYIKCIFKIEGSNKNSKLVKDGDDHYELAGNIAMIENASSKVVDWNNSKIYFALDGKVYTYRDGGNINDCREVNVFQDDQKITLDPVVAVMNMPNSMTAGGYLNKIFISTYSEDNQGKVYVLEPDQAECMNLFVREVIPVEGKVKSVCRWTN